MNKLRAMRFWIVIRKGISMEADEVLGKKNLDPRKQCKTNFAL